MIKLLAVDMDGTCLTSRSTLTDRTLRALRDAAGKGIIIVPTTGRNMLCLPHRLAAGTLNKDKGRDAEGNRDLFRYVISSNGGRVTDIADKKDLFQAMLPKETALSILERCRGKRLGIASHMKYRYLIQGKPLAFMGRVVYGRDAGGVCCVRDMYDIVCKSRYEVEELQIYFLSSAARKQVDEIMSEPEDACAAYTGIYAEIFSKEASKGRALAALAEKLGIEKQEIACIGDGENDLSMFEASGLKIAMGNAVSGLKEQADYITATNNRDGVAEAVYKKILR